MNRTEKRISRSLSLQVMPTFIHRNLVETEGDMHDMFSLGFGGRMKFTKRASFNFDTFFAPGSIAELKLSLNVEGRGTWVPIKSLSQSEQGIWAIYTINEEKVVVRDLVEILYFEGEYAYVNGTLNDGYLIVLGGAQKIIEGKSLNIQ